MANRDSQHNKTHMQKTSSGSKDTQAQVAQVAEGGTYLEDRTVEGLPSRARELNISGYSLVNEQDLVQYM